MAQDETYKKQLEQHIKSLSLSYDDTTDEIDFTKYKIRHYETCLERLYKGRQAIEEQLELANKQLSDLEGTK